MLILIPTIVASIIFRISRGAINFWNPGDQARLGEDEPGWRAVYSWAFDDKVVKPYIPGKEFFATDTFTDWSIGWLEEKEIQQNHSFCFFRTMHPGPFMLTRRIFQV